MRALIVEDDAVIGADVVSGLTRAGFICDLVADGDDAWFAGDTEDYSLAVLDLGLPGLDGLTVLERWRATGRRFPVLVLSARSDWTEKVEGIEAGADDYLAKPFELGELVSRARALVRRAGNQASAIVDLGRIVIDSGRMRVMRDGDEMAITALEFRLLQFLANQDGGFVDAGAIAENLYGVADIRDANAVEALVKRLRRKVGAEAIETRRGLGYRLVREA